MCEAAIGEKLDCLQSQTATETEKEAHLQLSVARHHLQLSVARHYLQLSVARHYLHVTQAKICSPHMCGRTS